MTAQAAYMWSQDDWGDANREGRAGRAPASGVPRVGKNKKNKKNKKIETRALPRQGTEGDDRRLGENLPSKKTTTAAVRQH